MRKNGGKVKAVILFVIAGIFLSSCGYELVKGKGIYGGDITSLGVPIFKNKSYEPHAPQYVTEEFTRELVSSGLFQVNKEDPDGYIEGTIKAVRINPYSLSTAGVAVEKQIFADLEIVLFRRNGVFVKRWVLSDSEIYRVDNLAFEDFNKREALRRVSARMARKFTSMLLVSY